jgi:O-antigen/teichoic acid export membrane protein
MTRTRAAIFNYVSALALSATTMATGLVATPFLLRWLGRERFGANRAALDAVGYLALFQLGYTAVILPLLAESLNKADIRMLRRTLAMGMRFFAKVVIVTFIAGLILATYIGKIVHVDRSIAPDLKRAVLISLIGFIFLPLTPLRTLADVGQESWVISLSLLAQSMVITGLSLVLAKAGFGISGQAISVLAGICLFQVMMVIRSRRRVPDLINVALREPDSPVVKRRLREMQLWAFLLHVSVTASFFTDNLIIGYFMGATTVTSFFLTQRLIVISQSQIQGIAGATWAGLTELRHAGHTEAFEGRYFEILRLIVATALTILTPIVAFNRFFIHIWVPSTGYAGDLVTIVASVNALLFGLTGLWTSLLDGMGRLNEYARIGFTMGVVNFGASVLATKCFGISGPLLGTLFAHLTVGVWAYPWQIHRDFNISISQTARTILRPIAIVSPVALAMWSFARWIAPKNWLTLVPWIVGCESLFVVFVWCLVFQKSERAFWKSRLNVGFLSIRRLYGRFSGHAEAGVGSTKG